MEFCSYLIDVPKVIVNILRELSNLQIKQRENKEDGRKARKILTIFTLPLCLLVRVSRRDTRALVSWLSSGERAMCF